MVALVSVETILLVLLVVLVAGLLRSHAELLRRVGPVEGSGGRPSGVAVRGSPAGPGATGASALRAPPERPRSAQETVAAPLTGISPGGEAVALSFDGQPGPATLLAFLSSGCGTCAGFWETLGDQQVPGVQTVIVTRGSERERPAQLRSLTPDRVPVVMSSQAWSDYGVPGAPYFVLVQGEIRGEGVATSWSGLTSLLHDAVADAADSEAVGSGRSSSGASRARHVDETLAAAGILPGDPSLYPAQEPRR